MRKIVISLAKGGVGKTTSAVNLSAYLAQAGRRVLLIDVDSQAQCVTALGVAPDHNLIPLLDNEISPQDAPIQARDNLYLLSGGPDISGLQRAISRAEIGGERILAKALTVYDEAYDVAIIDTAPGWDSVSINALFYANEIIAPVAVEALALQGLVMFIQRIEAVQSYNPSLTLRYVLPTFLDGRVKKSNEILHQLSKYFGEAMCNPIRYNVRLSEAPGVGKTIFEYAPNSPGAADYSMLGERILSDD